MLYRQQHRKGAGKPSATVDEAGLRAWRAELPADWREMAVAPIAFEVFRDGELAAERRFGYDADRVPCYYAHRFRIEEPRSDDGEEFYASVLHAEAVTAWRLRDGRWLIHRAVRAGEHSPQRAFYSFSEAMPR